MLWTDKYRPQTLDEVIGNNKEKMKNNNVSQNGPVFAPLKAAALLTNDPNPSLTTSFVLSFILFTSQSNYFTNIV